MKRLLALALALVMVFTLASCTSGGGSSKATGTITVGTPAMNGDFIYGFGNSSYDKYVKDLTSGAFYYSLYYLTPDGDLPLNTKVVVNEKECSKETDADGNVTYTYTLQKNLKWNDGTDIKAKDYVFALLFQASKAWADAGATATDGDSLLGYKDYHEGTAERFKAVKLLGDYKFSFTIDAANLPYYYEPIYTNVYPLCSAVWAPNCTIDSNDDGAMIAGVDLAACAQNIANTERYKPTVTCGPYKFVSFEDQIATLEVNTYFKEDANGAGKPKVQNIVVKQVNSETDVDQVINGEIDLVTGVIEGAKIDASKSSPNTASSVYSRNGFGQLAFRATSGRPPTSTSAGALPA